jgi:hypothetical protein
MSSGFHPDVKWSNSTVPPVYHRQRADATAKRGDPPAADVMNILDAVFVHRNVVMFPLVFSCYRTSRRRRRRSGSLHCIYCLLTMNNSLWTRMLVDGRF